MRDGSHFPKDRDLGPQRGPEPSPFCSLPLCSPHRIHLGSLHRSHGSRAEAKRKAVSVPASKRFRLPPIGCVLRRHFLPVRGEWEPAARGEVGARGGRAGGALHPRLARPAWGAAELPFGSSPPGTCHSGVSAPGAPGSGPVLGTGPEPSLCTPNVKAETRVSTRPRPSPTAPQCRCGPKRWPGGPR